jgi:hypothetical protein
VTQEAQKKKSYYCIINFWRDLKAEVAMTVKYTSMVIIKTTILNSLTIITILKAHITKIRIFAFTKTQAILT